MQQPMSEYFLPTRNTKYREYCNHAKIRSRDFDEFPRLKPDVRSFLAYAKFNVKYLQNYYTIRIKKNKIYRLVGHTVLDKESKSSFCLL